jgi:hypothetical protein
MWEGMLAESCRGGNARTARVQRRSSRHLSLALSSAIVVTLDSRNARSSNQELCSGEATFLSRQHAMTFFTAGCHGNPLSAYHPCFNDACTPYIHGITVAHAGTKADYTRIYNSNPDS